MVAITQNQFRQKALSILEKDEDEKSIKLSGPQEKILLAAYGVYAREIGRKTDELKDEITDLKVISEKKEAAIVREQARTAIASMWNKEAAKQLCNFLVTPISDWGKSAEASRRDVILIDGSAEESFIEEDSEDAEAVANTIPEAELDDTYQNNLDKLPWFLWLPTSILTRILAE